MEKIKNFFYVITITLEFNSKSLTKLSSTYFPQGKQKIITRRLSESGLIEIMPAEDKPSQIYSKILEKVLSQQKNSNISQITVDFYNYWLEFEFPVNSSIKNSTLINLSDKDMRELLNRPITDLDISVKVMKILKKADLVTLGDVISKKERFFSQLRLFGKMSVDELKNSLSEKGLKLSD